MQAINLMAHTKKVILCIKELAFFKKENEHEICQQAMYKLPAGRKLENKISML